MPRPVDGETMTATWTRPSPASRSPDHPRERLRIRSRRIGSVGDLADGRDGDHRIVAGRRGAEDGEPHHQRDDDEGHGDEQAADRGTPDRDRLIHRRLAAASSMSVAPVQL